MSTSLEAEERKRKLVQLARERDRQEGRGFFNSEYQREMGKRGGSKGGSANTQKQFEQRQKMGRKQGPITGKANQSAMLQERLANYSIWAFSPLQKANPRVIDRGEEFYYVLSPKETFAALTNVLYFVEPGSIKNVAPMHKLFLGEKKQMYGWRLVTMLTRSEFATGILKFQEDYPGLNLIFEEENMIPD